MDNHFNSPAQVTALYAAAGAEKAGKPASVLILLGILAGALIAMGSAATNTASYGGGAVYRELPDFHFGAGPALFLAGHAAQLEHRLPV